MTMLLRYWNRRKRWVEFNDETGRARVRWFLRDAPSASYHGWAHRFRGHWYGCWSTTHDVCFRRDEKVWSRSRGDSCSLTQQQGHRRFQILRDGRVEVDLRYEPYQPWFDVTWDALDDEIHDFFLSSFRQWEFVEERLQAATPS